MTARFGRNKRRAAREAIAALSQRTSELAEAHALSDGLLRHISEAKGLLEKELANAKKLAGRMSILFPATHRMEVGMQYDPHVTIEVVPDRQYASFEEMPEFLVIESLEAVMVKISSDQLSQAMHCQVKFAGGEWAYAITQSAWQMMTRKQRVQTLVHELPKYFASQMAEHEIGGRRR